MKLGIPIYTSLCLPTPSFLLWVCSPLFFHFHYGNFCYQEHIRHESQTFGTKVKIYYCLLTLSRDNKGFLLCRSFCGFGSFRIIFDRVVGFDVAEVNNGAGRYILKLSTEWRKTGWNGFTTGTDSPPLLLYPLEWLCSPESLPQTWISRIHPITAAFMNTTVGYCTQIESEQIWETSFVSIITTVYISRCWLENIRENLRINRKWFERKWPCHLPLPQPQNWYPKGLKDTQNVTSCHNHRTVVQTYTI